MSHTIKVPKNKELLKRIRSITPKHGRGGPHKDKRRSEKHKEKWTKED